MIDQRVISSNPELTTLNSKFYVLSILNNNFGEHLLYVIAHMCTEMYGNEFSVFFGFSG